MQNLITFCFYQFSEEISSALSVFQQVYETSLDQASSWGYLGVIHPAGIFEELISSSTTYLSQSLLENKNKNFFINKFKCWILTGKKKFRYLIMRWQLTSLWKTQTTNKSCNKIQKEQRRNFSKLPSFLFALKYTFLEGTIPKFFKEMYWSTIFSNFHFNIENKNVELFFLHK